MAAKNSDDIQPRELTPEELPAEPVSESVPAAGAPRAAANWRKPAILGGSIAAGVLALGLSFGGGYALGNAHDSHGFGGPGQGSFADGQAGPGGQGGRGHDGDRDGDHGGFQGGFQGGQGGQGGQMLPGAPGQAPNGQSGQTLPGAPQAPQTGTNGSTTTP